MSSPHSNVSSIVDGLGRLRLTVEANLMDEEDTIGDTDSRLPPPSVDPINASDSAHSPTQHSPLPLSSTADVAQTLTLDFPSSVSSDLSNSSSKSTQSMKVLPSTGQTPGTSPPGDSGSPSSSTESLFYLTTTTSASPFVRRSSLSHPSLVSKPSISQSASSTNTASSPAYVASMTSQFTFSFPSASTSPKGSSTSKLLPLAPAFHPATQAPAIKGSPPSAFPLVTLAPVRESAIRITAPPATSSATDMSDSSQPAGQTAVQATPPRGQPGVSPAQTPAWVCQTPVWVTAPQGTGQVTPSPTLSAYQAPSTPAEATASPKGVMSFHVPSPVKSAGEGSPTATRIAAGSTPSLLAGSQPVSPSASLDKLLPSTTVPMVQASFTQTDDSVNLLGDAPETEDLLTDNGVKGMTLTDQLVQARVLEAAPSSQATSTSPVDLRPTHTPLERTLPSGNEAAAESMSPSLGGPKSGKYGDISLVASVTGSSAGKSTPLDGSLQLSAVDPIKRSTSAASASSNPGKSASVRTLAAMYDQQAGKGGQSPVARSFSDGSQILDAIVSAKGEEGSAAKVFDPLATVKGLTDKQPSTEPLAIAEPGFRPQSSVYDADDESDTEAGAARDQGTDTETEAPKLTVDTTVKLKEGSSNSLFDDITEKPFTPTVRKLNAAKAQTSQKNTINGLEEGKAEVEELERLWTDFKDGVAVFGGGIDEVIARLTKAFKDHRCAVVQIAGEVPTANATSMPSSVDVKALEVKRQEFDDLRRNSEALRARALKAEGEAREAAERADTLAAEISASKRKGEAGKERIEELTRLYDSSESLCNLLRKRNQSVGLSFVSLEETHKQLEEDYNKLKEETKETHGFVAVFMEGEGRMFDPSELARGYDGGSKWANRIRSETVRLSRLMNNDTEVPILMYLYFDIQKTITELLESGSIKDVSQFDDFMEGFSSTEDLITVSDVSGAVGASVKIRAKMSLMSGFRACRLIYLVAGKDKGYIKDIKTLPKAAQAKIYAARSTGADEAEKDPFIELGNDHLFYADCFFPKTSEQWSNEVKKVSGQRPTGQNAPQQPQLAASQHLSGQGPPPAQQQYQAQQPVDRNPNPGPLDPNHTGLTARPGAVATLQQPINPEQYGTPPPHIAHSPLAPSQSPVAPAQAHQQAPAQSGMGWGQNRSVTYSHPAPPQGPPQGAPQHTLQPPHADGWGQRTASWSQPPQQQQQPQPYQGPPSQQQQGAPPPQQQHQHQQQGPPQQQQQQGAPQQWQQGPSQGWQQGPSQQSQPWQQQPQQQPQQPQPQQSAYQQSQGPQQPPQQQQQQQGWGQSPAQGDSGWNRPAPQWQPQGANPQQSTWGQPPPSQPPQQQQQPAQAQPQQPPWNQYGSPAPAQPQQQTSPAVEGPPQNARYNEVPIIHRRGYAGSIGGSPPSTDEDRPLLRNVPQTSRTFVSRPPQFARPEEPIQRPGSSNSLISMVSSAVHGRGGGIPPTFRVREVSVSSQPPRGPQHQTQPAPHAPQAGPPQAPPPWAQHGGDAQKFENNSDWRL